MRLLFIISVAGNLPDTKPTTKRLLDNQTDIGNAVADDIAAFLHKTNPKNWPEATLQSAMKMHLEQTLDEATHRLEGKYDQDIRDYDEAMKHILMMADTLSGGIIKQFPAKFDEM